MKENFIYRIGKISFIIFLLVFIVFFLKSGYRKSDSVEHDLKLARKCADRFMLFLAEKEFDRGYNLYFSPVKALGQREDFKNAIIESFETVGDIREILFIASYPQPDGPYFGLHYKGLHEKVRSVDYYFLVIREETGGYSVFELVFGESGTFYPDFSFKKERKGKPVVIYKKKH